MTFFPKKSSHLGRASTALRLRVRRRGLLVGAIVGLAIFASQSASAATDDGWGDEEKQVVTAKPVESASLYGSTGLLRLSTAGPAVAGALRFQLAMQYFRATEFLASAPFDTNRHTALGISITYSPV